MKASNDRTPSDWDRSQDRERVRDANPIEEVIADYVTLLNDGRNLKALCPFHNEKTPSFKVDPIRGSYVCFGCGERGDVFSFVQKQENIDFPQALQLLAERRGIELQRRGPGRPRHPGELGRNEQHALLLRAQRWFQDQLRSAAGKAAREYLERRGFDSECLQKFGVGYAPAGWSQLVDLLRRERVSLTAAAELGLVRARQVNQGRVDESAGFYDAFRHRIVFPIRDLPGRVVGFGARRLAQGGNAPEGREEPKYINSPESPLFRKGQLLYGHFEGRDSIRQQRELWVMEGYTDVMAAHQSGFPCAVATLGTALTEQNVDKLQGFADRLTLLFDGDRAGREAARKAVALLCGSTVEVRVVLFANGQDPCEILSRDGGAELLASLVTQGRGALEFIVDELIEEHGVETGERKERIAQQFFPFLEKLPSELRRREGWQLLAARLRAPEHDVQADYSRWLQDRGRRSAPRDSGRSTTAVSVKDTLRNDEDAFLLAALSSRERAQILLALVPPALFQSEVHRRLAFAVAATLGSEDSATGSLPLAGTNSVPARVGEQPVELDSVGFEEPQIKAKLLELQESLEEQPLTNERAVEFLRELLIRLLTERSRELRSAVPAGGGAQQTSEGGDPSSRQRRLQAMELQRSIAALRGKKVEDWEGLVEVARSQFAVS